MAVRDVNHAWQLGHDWDQSQWFLEASRDQLNPGEASFYLERPVNAADPTDRTDFHPGQQWTMRSLPDILYVLRPPQEWFTFKARRKPAQKVDANGNLRFEAWPKNPAKPEKLLDFKVLPDKIGTKEFWFVLEAWRRLDPRMDWKDITMRMPLTGRPSNNNLQQLVTRHVRTPFALLPWSQKTQVGIRVNANGLTAPEDNVLGRLTAQQVANNTTRGSTPGLVDPSLGPGSAEVPFTDDQKFAPEGAVIVRNGQAQTGNGKGKAGEGSGLAGEAGEEVEADLDEDDGAGVEGMAAEGQETDEESNSEAEGDSDDLEITGERQVTESNGESAAENSPEDTEMSDVLAKDNEEVGAGNDLENGAEAPADDPNSSGASDITGWDSDEEYGDLFLMQRIARHGLAALDDPDAP